MTIFKTAALGAMLAAAAAAGSDQVAQKKVLTLDGARRAIAAAVAEARKNNATGVIAVVDDGGNLMALERIDDTFAAGANISIGKARTAALFKRPTKFFEEVIGKGRTAMVALNDFTPLQGGVPIEVEGQVVGAVGVSGANSAQQDEEFARAGAAALAAAADDPSSNITYFESAKVAAAFDQGVVLFDGQGANYMVHASRRTTPGMAEIHTKDADIIYVLEGASTFITGGTAVAAHTTAPDELRGTEISGGETRQLHKGDVIIVPAGTPHWFKEVTDPFLYYVVKVR